MKAFRPLVLVFAGFVLVQVASAAALFALKFGLTPAKVGTSFVGDGALIRPRSMAGLLEVLVPHLLAIPLTVYVVVHLISWAKGPSPGLARLSRVTFGLVAIGLFAGFGVRYLWPGLAVVKLAVLLGEELTLSWLVWLLLRAARGGPETATTT